MSLEETRLDTSAAPHPDFGIVRRTLLGDRSSAGALVQRLGSIRRTLASRNARLGRPIDRAEIDDLAQDIAALVWSKLAEYAGRCSFDGWVHRFCMLGIASYRRRRRRLPKPLPDPPCLAGRGSTERDVYLLDRVEEALAALEPDTRAIIRLKCGEDRTFEEIGVRLGLSPNTVKTRYYRGLVRLRNRLRRFVAAEHGDAPARPPVGERAGAVRRR